jgi:hypothetical protein
MHIFKVRLPVTSTSRFGGFFLQFVTAITDENLVVRNKRATGTSSLPAIARDREAPSL